MGDGNALTLDKKKFKISDIHTYTIIAAVVLLAFAFCWILPAGEYDRVYDDLTDSEVVKLNEYMDYIQSILINDDKNKLLKAINNISKGKKVKVKHRWRDIKKKG